MKKKKLNKSPTILVVTPEITHLPEGMGNMANHLTAKGGGLADVSATLVSALFDKDVDIHVAMPHYRKIFHVNLGNFLSEELLTYKRKLPEDQFHLAEDRAFYYLDQVYNANGEVNDSVALAFQREVINNIIPRVRPDIIHCNDWMTGLIPAFARRVNIPCLFTIHNIHTHSRMMSAIEDRGIDVAEFWRNLYFERTPSGYEESRDTNQVDFLCSGVFSAHFINTVSHTFLREIIDGKHGFIKENLRREISHKNAAGCATGVLNSPDASYNPSTDKTLLYNFDAKNHQKGKRDNKVKLQKKLGLKQDKNAALFFWPSRLDPVQKGCQLLSDIFYEVISNYWNQNLQIVIVANGPFQKHFHDIINFHKIHERAVICDYDEDLSRLGYASSDFLLMPSLFEPCGLPQMICQIYGSLPVAHDTGGIHDTVQHLDVTHDTGNGFLFKNYDLNGLHWAIGEAMKFHSASSVTKKKQISRVMSQSISEFNHQVTAEHYLNIYNRMLERPLRK